MEFLISGSVNFQQSFSSRARTSNSKRGIKVTLSKQKSIQSKHQSSTQRHNPQGSPVNSLGSQNRLYETQYNQSGYGRLQSDQTEIIRFSESQSPKSDLISSYFEKSHQKQCAKKESAVLDEQIRKLQLQIYNTRTKITEAKYLAKNQSQSKLLETIKNSRRPKQKIRHEEIQIKGHKSLKNQNNQNQTMKASHKRGQEYFQSNYQNQNAQINDRSQISVIHDNSPTKFMKSQGIPRSPSPPHPSVLRQILSSNKKASSKLHIILQNQSQFYRKDISLSQQPIKNLYYNSSDFINQVPKQWSNQHNQQSQNLDLDSIQAKQVPIKNTAQVQNNSPTKIIKSSKQTKKGSTKKRSMSVYSSSHAPSYFQNTKKIQFKKILKRKSNLSDFNIGFQNHIKNRKKQKNLNILLSEIYTNKQIKNKNTKKGVFNNELLTKTYNLDQKNTRKIQKIENDKKSKEKTKKLSKKNENEVSKVSYNSIGHNNKIHQLTNNSSHHSSVKSKYIMAKNPFY